MLMHWIYSMEIVVNGNLQTNTNTTWLKSLESNFYVVLKPTTTTITIKT